MLRRHNVLQLLVQFIEGLKASLVRTTPVGAGSQRLFAILGRLTFGIAPARDVRLLIPDPIFEGRGLEGLLDGRHFVPWIGPLLLFQLAAYEYENAHSAITLIGIPC